LLARQDTLTDQENYGEHEAYHQQIGAQSDSRSVSPLLLRVGFLPGLAVWGFRFRVYRSSGSALWSGGLVLGWVFHTGYGSRCTAFSLPG
jgi:hypothetical protein